MCASHLYMARAFRDKLHFMQTFTLKNTMARSKKGIMVKIAHSSALREASFRIPYGLFSPHHKNLSGEHIFEILKSEFRLPVPNNKANYCNERLIGQDTEIVLSS